MNAPMKKCFIIAGATVLVLIYLFPYTWMVLSAFRRPVDTLALQFPFEISFRGFENVFRQTVFGLYLLNSIFITRASVAITMLIATPAAYALVRIGRTGAAFLLAVLIARMIPTWANPRAPPPLSTRPTSCCATNLATR